METNRMLPCIVGAAAVVAILIVVGAPLGGLLPYVMVLACPLTMIFMMRAMAGGQGTGTGEDHTGHSCDHDPTLKAEPPAGTAR